MQVTTNLIRCRVYADCDNESSYTLLLYLGRTQDGVLEFITVGGRDSYGYCSTDGIVGFTYDNKWFIPTKQMLKDAFINR